MPFAFEQSEKLDDEEIVNTSINNAPNRFKKLGLVLFITHGSLFFLEPHMESFELFGV